MQDDECYFNSIDWKVDGDCISDNKCLKKLIISFSGRCLGRPSDQHYILGEQGHNLPTRQQLQDFFSCIYQNRSINIISIPSVSIGDEFGGSLIEGLCGHCSLIKLEICGQERLGNIGRGYSAIGKVLNHPE